MIKGGREEGGREGEEVGGGSIAVCVAVSVPKQHVPIFFSDDCVELVMNKILHSGFTPPRLTTTAVFLASPSQALFPIPLNYNSPLCESFFYLAS